MTIRHLNIFVTVCEKESVTGAAEALYLAQPAVSLGIKELEEHYRVKLFDRISKRLYLTEEGRKLLGYAAPIISLYREMEQNMGSDDPAGTLRIGCSVTIGTCFLSEYLTAFQKRYPQALVRVCINRSSIIEEKVLKNELDFGFIEGAVHSDYLRSEPYQEDELAVLCGRTHPFYHKGNVLLEELLTQPLLLREQGSGTREVFENAVAGMGGTISPAWESMSTGALLEGTIAGIGISVLPYRLAKSELEDGRLRTVSVPGLNLKRTFFFVYHKNKYFSKMAESFAAVCRMT